MFVDADPVETQFGRKFEFVEIPVIELMSDLGIEIAIGQL